MESEMNNAEGEQAGKPQSAPDTGPKELSDADFEDLKAKNRPQARLFAPTGKIEATALNNKRI
jgi:hypothetical protein|tara:strand:+ start:1053 stop:1241 length:189 start_codon:yes stop_codon:yes gene_type:complete